MGNIISTVDQMRINATTIDGLIGKQTGLKKHHIHCAPIENQGQKLKKYNKFSVQMFFNWNIVRTISILRGLSQEVHCISPSKFLWSFTFLEYLQTVI